MARVRYSHSKNPSPGDQKVSKATPASAAPAPQTPEMRAIAHISTGSRRPPRQTRAQNTVEAILEAAAILLVERGFARVSTNTIAARAGVSIGSLYQYFASKDAIYSHLVHRHHEQVHRCVQRSFERMQDPACPLVDGLVQMMLDLTELHQQNPRLMRAMVTELAVLESKPMDAEHALRWGEALLRSRPECQHLDVETTAQLLGLTIENLSVWLSHHAPEAIDRSRFLLGVEKMFRGLLSGATAAEGPAQ